MRTLCEGHFEDQARVIVNWSADKTETPIAVRVAGADYGKLLPNEDTIVPECIAEMLGDSGYEIAISPIEDLTPSDDHPMDAPSGEPEGEAGDPTPITDSQPATTD